MGFHAVSVYCINQCLFMYFTTDVISINEAEFLLTKLYMSVNADFGFIGLARIDQYPEFSGLLMFFGKFGLLLVGGVLFWILSYLYTCRLLTLQRHVIHKLSPVVVRKHIFAPIDDTNILPALLQYRQHENKVNVVDMTWWEWF